jgi:hypothetical protein
VLKTDPYESDRAKEFIFAEVYTTDLNGMTRMKFTESVDMARV